MSRFDVPSAPSVYTEVLTNFLGADFTSILPDKHRFSEFINFVNNNGNIETRPGYAQVEDAIGTKINGIWNVDVPSDLHIIHSGTKLYSVTPDFKTETELLSGLADVVTQKSAFYMNNYLLIFDGTRAIVYGYFDAVYKAVYLDTVGTVPTKSINRNPDGTGGIANEPINFIQPYMIDTFVGTVSATEYYLSETACDTETPTATRLKSDGTWETHAISAWDKTTGKVTFITAPGVSPIDNQDNVSIRFKKTNSEAIGYINEATIGWLYGYGGNRNRIFVSGNPDFVNNLWYTQDEDPLYWPADNYLVIGTMPIINFTNLNDGTLGVQKNVSDSDLTMYYVKGVLFNNAEGFRVLEGTNSIGCISKYANSNLLNDPLTLTEKGVYGVNTSSSGERFVNERSYFVKTRLLAETNLQNAISIVFENKYYLAVNDHVYIADARYQSRIPDAATGSYSFQYEWYYWDTVPVRVWYQYNDELYFGTVDGKIVKFNTTCLNYTTPISCRIDSAFLNLGSIDKAKTVKRVTVISNPDVATQFTLGYVTDEGDEDIIVKQYTALDYPRTLQEKEKIPKFMYFKLYVENNTSKKASFHQMAINYIISGNYRGD